MTIFSGYGELQSPIPDNLTFVQFMLDYQHPDRPTGTNPALIEDATGRRIGLNELRKRAEGFANALSSQWNIGSDDVVCIFAPNHVDYAVMIWGIHELGAIVSPANPAYTSTELEHQLRTVAAKLVVCHASTYAVTLEATRAIGINANSIILLGDPNDSKKETTKSHPTVSKLVEAGLRMPKNYEEYKLRPGEAKTKLAFLCFSSGTTGLPKAVKLAHYSVIANIIQTASYMNSDKRPVDTRYFRTYEVVLGVLPFYHVYGLVFILHFGLWYGWNLVVVTKFNFVDVLKSIQRYRITYLPLVPPIAVLLCKHPETDKYDLGSIRTIHSGAAPLSAELMQQLVARFPDARIGQGFGMTEACCLVALPPLQQKVGTIGSSRQLLTGITAKVIRSDGTPAPPGEPGQLVLKGPAMSLGYLGNNKATRETFVDGWVYSGDEVYINENSELFVIDRIKELLKVRGLQVAPAELEGFLLDHPDVSDACVVSILDDYHGDLPLAFIVPSANVQGRIKRDPAEADKIKAALIKYVADGKAYYKQLTAGVVLVEAIPRNPSGKLLRRHLRDQARQMWKNDQLKPSKGLSQAKL